LFGTLLNVGVGLNPIIGFFLKSVTQTTPREPNKNKKEQDNKAKIGRVAAKLFKEKGYSETRVDDISNVAKLSKGGIYHYFFSKNEILYFKLGIL
jgi:hypothetical protein